ncbi:GNAT family N-acetyltransferase [Paenibacillus sp. HB172176]|uniref:GNAT family N-acetyltransferase n=1 Tax=Paenibacillus sp. HB172176 TaxID=2493690 RepID=UPI001F0D3EAD|nr:GNAT family N-acetyltransferase [Paenibacillus sp. HB172176]
MGVEGRPRLACVRNYIDLDFDGMIEVQRACFPPPFPEELLWNHGQLGEHVTRFPEGALCAELDGEIVGSMTGLIVNWNDYQEKHSWAEITDHGYIRNHDSGGDCLYVVDLCVVPWLRKTGLGKILMQSMYETVVQLGLARLLGGGRMPGYSSRASEANPEQYVRRVVAGEWQDPVLSFLLRCGRMPVGVLTDYLDDEESRNNAVLMEWRNPFRMER